jgi:hypothetical protein
MHYLITPMPDGPDSILAVNDFGKSLVEMVSLDAPVEIAGHSIVAYPKLTRFEMSGNGGGHTYQVMMSILENATDLRDIHHTFPQAWARLCSVAGLEGRITILLVDAQGKILLFTFDTDIDEFDIVHVRKFDVPTMYQQGRIITHGAIMDQLLERRRTKDEALKRSFAADDLAGGFDIHDLDLE